MGRAESAGALARPWWRGTGAIAKLVDASYPPPPMSAAVRPLFLLFAVVLWGCTPSIGDDCDTALDCSAQATRLCDQTQPGGYCTLPGCDMGTCPDEAVCVLFRPETPRLSVSYCMLECESDSDCRDGEGYRCLRASDFGLQRRVISASQIADSDDDDAGVDETTAEPDAGVGSDVTSRVVQEAKVLDGNSKRFCAQPASLELAPEDAVVVVDDAGAPVLDDAGAR